MDMAVDVAMGVVVEVEEACLVVGSVSAVAARRYTLYSWARKDRKPHGVGSTG